MIRTFIVEDDFRVAALHRTYTERLDGFTVIGNALTGEQALRDIETLRPDLVLLDIYLPDRSGLSVAKEIRAMAEPQPGLMFVTAARDVETVRMAMRDGALHYLVKPFAFRTFREKLLQYQEWVERLDDAHAADQATIDQLYSTLRPRPIADLPKGLSPPTLEVVLDALQSLGEPASATEVAARSGVSRATARRYLDHLAEAGRVERRLRYGTTGRPEHRFTLEVPATQR